jgi:hypothetical protein
MTTGPLPQHERILRAVLDGDEDTALHLVGELGSAAISDLFSASVKVADLCNAVRRARGGSFMGEPGYATTGPDCTDPQCRMHMA